MRRPLLALLIFCLLPGCQAGFASQAHALASGTAAAQGKGRHGDRDVARMVAEANAAVAERDAKLIAEKYALLADNAFSFFRGTAFMYYADVADEPTLRTTLSLPLMGDLHLENLGTYRTAGGAVAYDMNDFDEAATGPYTWELARMAVSIRLAAKEAKRKDKGDLVTAFLDAYGRHLAALDPASLQRPLTQAGSSAEVVEAIALAGAASRTKFLGKLGKAGRFEVGKKIRAVSPELARQVSEAVATYARAHGRAPAGFFQVKDVASRVAGTASIGRYRFVAWIEGASASADDDVILELKEEAAPTLQPRATGDQARRVADAYRYFLPEFDPLLGTTQLKGLDFIVRELSPAKESVSLSKLGADSAFSAYLDRVALAAARAHARSGKRAAILSELKTASGAIAAFADRYADQVAADHAAYAQSR